MASLESSSNLNAAPFDCPTLQHLNVDPSTIYTTSRFETSNKWFSAFAASISSEDLDSLIPLFHEHGFWKDILTLTWDMRTIRGHASIRRLLDARLAMTGLSAFHLIEGIRGPTLIIPLSGLVFIRFCFTFETKHGKGIAVAFLVPTSNSTWKAWSLLTRLDSLNAYPEKIGCLRPRFSLHESSEDGRQREIDFDDVDPTVLVIGAGHCGLEVAARLTYLGVPTLVIDRNQRIGDNWRTRYKTLCLHDPSWTHHMPYLDFPETWPVYCSALKLGDWLEAYATALDLNVWLSSSITSTTFNQEKITWQVSVNRGGRTMTMTVKHLVFATGFGGGFPKVPDIPGKELYCGSVLHSTQFTSGTEYEGKKVIVVGACNSAHDIAHDLCRHGCDVTMIQRSPTYVISREALEISFVGRTYDDNFPIEFADVLGVALPFATVKHMQKVSVAQIANGIDKELLDNLAKAGFQTYLGPDGAGLLPLVFEKGGGLYIDTGASQEIINGTIKVRSSPAIRRFAEGGVELEDGSVLEGDAVIFATGFGDIRGSVEEICGPDVAAKVGKVWGLDVEGELQRVWRRTGHPRLWIAMANLSRSRLHSLHLALRIKAIEEGIIQEGEITG
ncbi:FAD/NAD(P)-binding domain-containing protein [Imleria badia]|nr:FAD/NAD(P)-binding domain-containing protein [Imleria badia]